MQVIFFGFFLFAANQATQGGVQRQVAILARVFGVVTVTKYLDATSKLIAISDLKTIEVAAPGDKRRKAFEDLTSLLDALDSAQLRRLAAMDERQRDDFVDLYMRLTPTERSQFREFLKRYGAAMLERLLTSSLKKNELEDILSVLSKLPTGEQGAFMTFTSAFTKADKNTRTMMLAAAATISQPTCFDKRQALSIREIHSGYSVQPLIADVESETARFAGSARRVGEHYQLSEAEFSTFAARITAAHNDCTIRVLQSTDTYDERQFKRIQRWFRTW